jgi:sulfiredoxin
VLRSCWNDCDVAGATDALLGAKAELHLALEHPRDLLVWVAAAQRGRRRQSSTIRSFRRRLADVYVPIKRRATLERKRVDEIAASILDKGLQTPILVRADGARFVLVEGLHRLEAAKALGEKTIVSFLVDAPKH